MEQQLTLLSSNFPIMSHSLEVSMSKELLFVKTTFRHSYTERQDTNDIDTRYPLYMKIIADTRNIQFSFLKK